MVADARDDTRLRRVVPRIRSLPALAIAAGVCLQPIFRDRAAVFAPLPVLTLEQIGCNPHVRPLRCERRWTRYSDQRPVVADVSIIAAD
ncbi:MAG: hypothetical protein AB7U20_08405 [Planctomycetaceae bacterium]